MIRDRFATMLILASLGSAISTTVLADWKDDIGHSDLVTELGGATPTGAGIGVAIIEAGSATASIPHVADPQFTGKFIVDKNGNLISPPATPPTTASHATRMARTFFGNTSSVAPGVTSITSLNADDWLNNELGFGNGTQPSTVLGAKVINNSWVSRPATMGDMQTPADFAAEVALQRSQSENLAKRVDFLVNRDDVLVVAGTDNGSSRPLPVLLAPSFNSVIVGRSNGGHASGVTDFYQSGRTRPHLVAPVGSTSSATAVVSSTATMLFEAAAGTNAVHAETMRAVLMAGATKEASFGWDRTDTRPIDEVYGAGQVNAYNSFQIIDTGEVDGTVGAIVAPAAAGPAGFDFFDSTINAGTDSIFYEFDVDAGFVMEELSVFLSWNINVDNEIPPFFGFEPQVDFGVGGDLANLDLKLFDASNNLVQQSISTIDNYEHLYLADLDAGSYTLEVSRDQAIDFGLAWRSTLTSVTAVPEPGSFFAITMMMACSVGLRRRRVTAS